MATVNNFLSKVSSNIGAKFDAAKAALRGPATPPAEPGIGAQTSAALGDTPATPATGPTPEQLSNTRASLQAQTGAKAQMQMGGGDATGAPETMKPFQGGAGPQPIPDAPPGAATGGIGADAVAPAERVAAEGGSLRAAGVRTASAAEQAAAKGGGLMSRAGSLLRGAGAVGTVLAGADAADRAYHGTTSDQMAGRTTNPWLAGARQMQDTMTFGQGRKMSDAAIAGGAALFDDPGKNAGVVGRLGHAWDAAKGAWNQTGAEEAAAANGGIPPAAPKTAPVIPPKGPNDVTTSGTIGATPPVPGGVMLRGGQVVTPQAELAGNGVPASGTGVFQRSGGKAIAVGTPDGTNRVGDENNQHTAFMNSDGSGSPQLRGAQAQTASGVPQLGWLDKQFQTKREIAQAVAGWKVREAQSKLATEQQGRDATQRGVNDSILKTQLEGENDPNRPVFARDKLGKGDNKAEIDNYNNAEMQRRKADIQYTLNAMQKPAVDKDGNPVVGKDGKPVMVSAGRSYRNAAPDDMQGLGLLAKFKSNTMSARSGWDQTLRDLVGEPRGDSKNLLGYKPVSAERTTLPSFGKEGGYLIHLANGNTMPVFAANGGGFNVFGPNKPRDLDLDQFIAPLITKAQGKE